MVTCLANVVCKLIAFAITALLVLSAAQSSASVIYTYTGPNFTFADVSANSTIPPQDVYTTADRVSGFIELPAPLAANLGDAILTPISFGFSDGVNTITNLNVSRAPLLLQFLTDADGNLIEWVVGVSFFGFVPVDGLGIRLVARSIRLHNSFGFLDIEDQSLDWLCAADSPADSCFLRGESYYS